MRIVFFVDYQIDESKNYVIEASVEKVSESTKYVSQCGLMFGFKDWDNYNLLQINQRGQFCFEARRNGIYVFNSKWMNGIGPVRPHRSIKIKGDYIRQYHDTIGQWVCQVVFLLLNSERIILVAQKHSLYRMSLGFLFC